MPSDISNRPIQSQAPRRERRARQPIQAPPPTIGDYFDVVRRRWIYVVTILPAAIMISVIIAFGLPAMYLASGTILLEPASVPQDLIRTTVTSYADQQIELVRRRVMTIDNLKSLVEELDPYPDDELSIRAKARLVSQNTRIEKVDPITLEPLLESNAFSVHYYNPDAEIASEFASRLVNLFLDYNRTTRRERAEETYQFLQTQSEEVEDRVEQLEQRLADFKAEYGDALPESQARNRGALDRAQRDLDALERQTLAAEERKALLEVQLSEVSPYLFDSVGGWQAELAELKAELAEAQQRYTDDHPDVRRLRRSIAALSERVAATPESQRQAPDNPEYLRLTSQLETVNEELDAMRASANRARQRIRNYEKRLVMAPDVERNYRQLIRDHDIAQSQFRDIQNKLGEAALAQTLETEAQGERFSLIRAPSQPSTPNSPNRVGIILLGFVIGSAISAGMVALKESIDPSIRSARDLAEITDIKPIGVVPIMLNPADRRKRRLAWSLLILTIAIALLLLGSSAATGAWM